MNEFTEKHRILLIVECVVQNLQNMLYLVEKTENTECHFLGGKFTTFKTDKTEFAPPKITQN